MNRDAIVEKNRISVDSIILRCPYLSGNDLVPFEYPPGNQALFAADICINLHSPEYKSGNISDIPDWDEATLKKARHNAVTQIGSYVKPALSSSSKVAGFLKGKVLARSGVLVTSMQECEHLLGLMHLAPATGS